MTGTVAAIDTVGIDYAKVFDPYGMSDLNGRFVGYVDRLYGAGRTHVRTFGAFRPAIPKFIGHFRLHQGHKVTGWTQYLVGTDGYT